MKVGMLPRKSSKVCIFTAALCLRKLCENGAASVHAPLFRRRRAGRKRNLISTRSWDE
jgi:hypothetical protein